MELKNDIEKDFTGAQGRKALKEKLPGLVSETLDALTGTKTPYIFCMLKEDEKFLTAGSGDSLAHVYSVYNCSLAFMVCAMKNGGKSDDFIRKFLTDVIETSLKVCREDPDAPHKHFGFKKR